MAKRKIGFIKMLQTVGILCVFTLGLVSIVGTGADDVADLVDIPAITMNDVEVPLKIDVDEASLTPVGGTERRANALDDECETTSLQTLIDSIDDLEAKKQEVEEDYGVTISSIDIESFTLATTDTLEIYYENATWTEDTEPSITCDIEIYEEDVLQFAIDDELTIVKGDTSPTSVTLSASARTAIEKYTTNRTTEFTTCGSCEIVGDTVTNFSVDLYILINGTLVVQPQT